MTLDFSRPVTTRDGRAVRILCTDGPSSDYPVIGIIGENRGVEFWALHGYYHPDGGDSDFDLINPPVKRRGWVALCKSIIGTIKVGPEVYETENRAQCCNPGAIAVVQLPEWWEPQS